MKTKLVQLAAIAGVVWTAWQIKSTIQYIKEVEENNDSLF